MTPEQIEVERAKFEAWALENCFSVEAVSGQWAEKGRLYRFIETEMHLKTWLARAERAQADARWIPVAEKLPPDELEVLATGWWFNEPGSRRWQDIGAMKDGVFYKWEDGCEMYMPTHWKFKPAEPVEGEMKCHL